MNAKPGSCPQAAVPQSPARCQDGTAPRGPRPHLSGRDPEVRPSAQGDPERTHLLQRSPLVSRTEGGQRESRPGLSDEEGPGRSGSPELCPAAAGSLSRGRRAAGPSPCPDRTGGLGGTRPWARADRPSPGRLGAGSGWRERLWGQGNSEKEVAVATPVTEQGTQGRAGEQGTPGAKAALTLSPGSPTWPVGPIVPGGPGRPWN